jgi:hypothetical protein
VGEIVNLNRVRKRLAREKAAAKAGTNRAKFGRSKQKREQEEELIRRSETVLEQHRIEREDKP